MSRQSVLTALVVVGIILGGSCSTQRKLARLKDGGAAAEIEIAREESYVPQLAEKAVTRDTLKIKDDEGNEFLIMKAVKDALSGDVVAAEELNAATVTARFRNIAERHGKVDLAFQVIVPAAMQDSRWQLRFYPDMYMLSDSVRLEPVIITGNAYRRAQLKGYQQYSRFLSKIVSDSTRFVNLHQLEIFLRRNIPQVYAFKTDSTVVTDEQFYSIYGVSERQAVEHYTNKIARGINERRKGKIDKMYRKYIKAPIVSEGIRLDTVMVSDKGDFIYHYIQTINTRPRLRKVDIVLSGDIYEQDKRLYEVPRSQPLTFYISSISAFTDAREKYLTKVIERKAAADMTADIAFKVGSSVVDPSLGRNAMQLQTIRGILSSLVQNQVYDLDSIVVTASASPEGKLAFNQKLSRARSESISKYFDGWVRHVQDSLERDGYSVDEHGRALRYQRRKVAFLSRNKGEDWDQLDWMIFRDTVLSDGDKSHYETLASVSNPDAREYLMQRERWYPYVKNTYYPRLRRVAFDFHMHRKDMVKDTIHTTVLDSAYMRGVEALKNMDYETALRFLRPYEDFNTAIAYVGLDRDISAMEILSRQKETAPVNYLMAILYARRGDEQKAVERYLRSCRQNPSYVHRGNLDPEISALIKLYGLNRENGL